MIAEEILKKIRRIEIISKKSSKELFAGEYHWHKHEKEDELFYVYKGSIVIQMKDQPGITLQEGEMAVVPGGVEHCPQSLEPSYVLMFEPHALKSKGD